MQPSIRALTPEDAAEYRELRLSALREHPTAYCTDIREESAITLEEIQTRLKPTDSAMTFGAFHEQQHKPQLVGIGTLIRPARLRLDFRAIVVGMYVRPAHRRTGIARQLLTACIDRARSLAGVEEVCLSITLGNDDSKSTYLACGFQPDYVEPRYFKFEGRYYDLEWLRLPLV